MINPIKLIEYRLQSHLKIKQVPRKLLNEIKKTGGYDHINCAIRGANYNTTKISELRAYIMFFDSVYKGLGLVLERY